MHVVFCIRRSYIGVEGIAIPVPGIEKLDLVALILRPHIPVRKRRVQAEHDHTRRQEHDRASRSDDRSLLQTNTAKARGQEVIDLTQCHDGEVECREVVM